MRLSFESVSFKNFLTFGARPQTLVLERGLNIIMGMDADSKRSNGSGKSSLASTIPFALFGKTSKEVTKAGLINWKNRKNCEVILDFTRDGAKYQVLRAIKPDKLEIYQNGILIPPPSNVRDYQAMLEQDILHYDLTSFMSLTHTNLNDVQPILQMSVPTKRAFLEKIFTLGVYSTIIERANEKNRSIQETISKHKLQQDFNTKMIFEQEDQLDKLKARLRALPNTSNDIRDLKERIDGLKDKYENPELRSKQLDELIVTESKKLELLTHDQLMRSGTVTRIKSELALLKGQLKNYGDVDANVRMLVKARADIEGYSSDLDVEKVSLATDIVRLTTNKDNMNGQIVELKMQAQSLRSDLKNVREKLELLAGDKCPTCQGELKDNTLLAELKAQELELSDELNHTEMSSTILQSELTNTLTSLEAIQDRLVTCVNGINERAKLRATIDKLTIYETQQASYKALNDDISARVAQLNLEEPQLADVSKQIVQCKGKMKSYQDELEYLQSSVSMLSSLKDQLERLENRQPEDEQNRSDLQSMMDECSHRMTELTVSNRSFTAKINQLNDLTDYVLASKEVCQDDAVKQFAVSRYMPYITSRTNFYLSESGCNFYVRFKNWLELEIFGPGRSNCTYGNLSGGEARSIDIALQLAFLDISRMNTGVYSDLMVFDEILDSSVDDIGIGMLAKIIKTLQQEIQGKVFLITHRSEISNVDMDNLYVMEKIDGFSYVRKM